MKKNSDFFLLIVRNVFYTLHITFKLQNSHVPVKTGHFGPKMAAVTHTTICGKELVFNFGIRSFRIVRHTLFQFILFRKQNM